MPEIRCSTNAVSGTTIRLRHFSPRKNYWELQAQLERFKGTNKTGNEAHASALCYRERGAKRTGKTKTTMKKTKAILGFIGTDLTLSDPEHIIMWPGWER
jgi:hypothetical protein